jgi:hypothetical protein
MAKNLLGGTNNKNFARGEPPPVGSWEYAGMEGMGKRSPSAAAAPAQQKKIPVIVATMRETLVYEKKPKKLKYLGIGAAIGAVATFIGLKIHSY